MRITRKLPRTLSLIAAIFWLLTTVVGFITGLSNCFSLYGKDAAQITVYITTNLLSSLPSLICVLVLFVGKKKIAMGVLLILAAVHISGLGGMANIISIFSALRMTSTMHTMVPYYLLNGLYGLISGVFYILLAVECFKPGAFSASKAKTVLIILPVVGGVISICAMLLMHATAGSVTFGGVAGTILQRVINQAPIVLMGIAFAKPVYEADPYAAQYAAYTYDQQYAENPYGAQYVEMPYDPQYAEDPDAQQPVDPNYYG